ncbi:MAG TPA: hypothetical protein VER79_06125 [Candidatus Limnocylindrales bacterium]|nr:hypothetical protein [Candidatus Limnocylindrales bacterium]
MSIKFDWEVEAEREHIPSAGEDPQAKRRRRRSQLRLLIVILGAALLIGGMIAAVGVRLRYVDWEVENQLRDTIAAEVASLRLGDRESFLDVQRSADEAWIQQQSALFDRIQEAKITQDVALTGRVLEVSVDDPRGRARVEEISGGAAYVRTWFYWLYEDGWRHVPPDYTFWGSPQTIERPGLTVRYRDFDAPFAPVLAEAAAGWWMQGCALLGCEGLPNVTIEIVPDEMLRAGWSPADQWTLQVPSPFVRPARLDTPFDPALQVEVAQLLAGRLVDAVHGGEVLAKGSDAAYLRDALTNWLVGRWLGADTGTLLMTSFAARAGDAAVAAVARAITPESSISVVGDVVGAPLESLDLDWRDYLQQRLALEDSLIAAGDQTGVQALYDLNDSTAQGLALARLGVPAPLESPRVLAASPAVDAAGAPILRAQVQRGETIEEIVFRLTQGTWKRTN